MSRGAYEANMLSAAGNVKFSRPAAFPFGDQVEKAPDHVLVMALIKRGYAVAMAPPEDLLEKVHGHTD